MKHICPFCHFCNYFDDAEYVAFGKRARYKCLDKIKCKERVLSNKKKYKGKKFIKTRRIKPKGHNGFIVMPVWR